MSQIPISLSCRSGRGVAFSQARQDGSGNVHNEEMRYDADSKPTPTPSAVAARAAMIQRATRQQPARPEAATGPRSAAEARAQMISNQQRRG